MTHQHTNTLLLVALLFSVGLAFLRTGEARAADDEAVDMIVELLSGSDNDMRMLALQQIREKVPGKDATRRFVELLPKLPPDIQVKLIDALGERGDPAARPAILKMLSSETEALRAMAARALSGLASPADIPVLAKVAATGSDPEKKAARHSLRQLPGHEMSAAMTEALKNADAKSKIELMSALTDRNVMESLPMMLKSADDSDLGVRLAVLAAFRAMANENHTAVVVKRLKSAQDKSERRQAALALLATCRRGRTKCADAVITGFEGADATTRIFLMRALPLAGGPKSLNEIVARLKDDDEGVSVEAVRVLAGWPDPAAIPHLKELAHDVKNLRNHVLAIRGIVRLASPGKDHPADLATLSEAMKLATRKEEKVLVLGALGTIPTLESLALVASGLDQSEIAEDAGFAAVLIAEKINGGNTGQVRAVMQKVADTVQSEKTRDRAKKVMEASQPQASALKPFGIITADVDARRVHKLI
ncbi:MAG: HEAT repeat domain-containing protein [Planctomycetes bacterium]|nr:HEAT repeat domain-containing protein [Planctomycetota bacterium]